MIDPNVGRTGRRGASSDAPGASVAQRVRRSRTSVVTTAWLAGAVFGVLVVIGMAPGAGVAAADAPPTEPPESIRVGSVSQIDGSAQVDVIVPKARSGATVAADEFEVAQNGSAVKADVSRLSASPFQVDLAIEVPRGEEASTVKAAVSAFLLRLPPEARVSVLGSGIPPEPIGDRSAVLNVLRDLKPQSTETVASLLDKSTSNPSGGVPRVTVGYSTKDLSQSVLESVERAAKNTPGLSGQLVWLARPETPDDLDRIALTRLAPWKGEAPSIATTTGLLGAFDRVADELLGTYRLEVPESAGSSLDVSLSKPGGLFPVTVQVPQSAPDARGKSTSVEASAVARPPVAKVDGVETGSDGPWLWLFVGGLVLVSLVLGSVVMWRRHRSRPQATSTDTASSTSMASSTSPSAPAATASSTASPTSTAPTVSTAPPHPSRSSDMSAPSDDGTGRGNLSRSSTAFVDDMAEQLRIASTNVNLALSRLEAQRREATVPMPTTVAIAVEAAASGWLEYPAVVPAEVTRQLDPDGPPHTLVVRQLCDALGESLVAGDEPLVHLASRVAAMLVPTQPASRSSATDEQNRSGTYLDRSVEGNELDSGWLLNADGGLDENASIVNEVSAVIGLSAPRDGADTEGSVQRCLLSTWPARVGRLSDIPLILSPSLRTGNSLIRPSDFERLDLVILVMGAIQDAAVRMCNAEIGLMNLRSNYEESLVDQGRPPERAGAITELLTNHPVVDLGTAAAVLSVSETAAKDELDAICALGWLTPMDQSRDTDSPRRWIAHKLLAAITGPFADAELPLTLDAVDLRKRPDPTITDLTDRSRTISKHESVT